MNNYVRLMHAVLVGAMVGAILLAGVVLVTPGFAFLLAPTDDAGGHRIRIMAYLFAVSVGVGLGLIIRRLAIRYARTRIHMFGLITEADRVLVGLLSAIAAVVVLSVVFGLNSEIGWGRYPLLVATAAMLLTTTIDWLSDKLGDRGGTLCVPVGGEQAAYADSPITSEADDLLHRGVVLDTLVQLIQEGSRQRVSWAITLNGRWGSGKTSILRMLECRLASNPKFMVVWFDPWHFASQDQLLKAFFDTMDAAVSKQYLIPDLDSAFRKYRTVLGPALGKLGVSVDPFGKREVEGLRLSIACLTRSISPHIVVIIDDLDRLETSELYLVLKLIKLSASFPNVTYFLGMDRSKIEKRLGDYDGHSYLEKFIDVDVAVPVADQADLNRFFLDGFQTIALSSRAPGLRGIDSFKEVYLRVAWTGIQTLRDAKRTLNAFAIALRSLPGEVNVVDVLLLEIIRRISIEAWSAIPGRPEFFVREWQDQQFIRGIRLNDDKWGQKRADFCDQLLKMVPVSSQNVMMAILEEVFPSKGAQVRAYRDDQREQRACVQSYFERYFMYRLRESVVADRDVYELVSRINDASDGRTSDVLEKAIHRWRGNLDQVFDRLMVLVDELEPARHRDLVESIARSSRLFDNTRRNFGVRTEAERARALILAVASKHEDNLMVQELLQTAIHNATSLGFAADLLYFCQRNVNRIISNWDHVQYSSLESTLSDRIRKELVGTSRDILREEPDGWYHVMRLWTDKAEKLTYLRQLSQRQPNRVGEVLEAYVTPRGDNTLDLKALQDDWDVDGLLSLAASLGDSAAGSESARWALDQLRQQIGSEPA